MTRMQDNIPEFDENFQTRLYSITGTFTDSSFHFRFQLPPFYFTANNPVEFIPPEASNSSSFFLVSSPPA